MLMPPRVSTGDEETPTINKLTGKHRSKQYLRQLVAEVQSLKNVPGGTDVLGK